MQLVDNWKEIALKSHSMRAVYAGAALLLIPEIWFLFNDHQLISPYIQGYGGILLLAWGGIGRLFKQKTMKDG